MINWLNGNFTDESEQMISIKDRGFLIGDGIFETLYYGGQQLECFTAHLQRLRKGLNLLQIPFKKNPDEIEKLILDLLQKNQLTTTTAAVRLTITRGIGERGLAIPTAPHPTFLIQCFPYKREKKFLKIGFSRHCHPGLSSLSSIKHLGYQLSILGRLEVQERELDDVLFLNGKNEVVCSTAGNVFALIGDEYITPPLTSGCLPGIKRGQLIQSKQMQVSVRPLLKEDILEKAEAIFITNSLIDKHWVKEIEGRILPKTNVV